MNSKLTFHQYVSFKLTTSACSLGRNDTAFEAMYAHIRGIGALVCEIRKEKAKRGDIKCRRRRNRTREYAMTEECEDEHTGGSEASSPDGDGIF